MDIVARLSIIQQEIQRVESEKLQQEQRLGLIWEHLPPIDPEVVGRAMQSIRDRIRTLEDHQWSLLLEQQELPPQQIPHPIHREMSISSLYYI